MHPGSTWLNNILHTGGTCAYHLYVIYCRNGKINFTLAFNLKSLGIYGNKQFLIPFLSTLYLSIMETFYRSAVTEETQKSHQGNVFQVKREIAVSAHSVWQVMCLIVQVS